MGATGKGSNFNELDNGGSTPPASKSAICFGCGFTWQVDFYFVGKMQCLNCGADILISYKEGGIEDWEEKADSSEKEEKKRDVITSELVGRKFRIQGRKMK